jgi:hypothetical protein
MWDLLYWVIAPASRFFEEVYDADRRPEARRFTVGCFLVFALVVLLIGALVKYFG